MPRITEMYAFVVADKGPDDEGVMAFCDQRTGQWFPMVGADTIKVEEFRPIADKMSAVMGKPYKILRFELVETLQAPAAN